mmetsp:Transcript_70101/g.146181  ORF Transcript_70101/g.146181 Transcript_70101/m.146181 type:complete len:285 (+) Transcript_70101:280-1134(+)
MDIVVQVEDYLIFDKIYQTLSPDWLGLDRSNVYRQFITIYITVAFFGVALYVIFSGLNWVFFFDKAYLNDPKILKNQVRREITTTLASIPFMTLLTAPIFLAEVRGYSKLTEGTPNGIAFEVMTVFTFLMFTDMCIYWIHRGLHHPSIYPYVHKTHHLWKVPTPWASHAFHPLDGFSQGLPYHIYVFLFPMNKFMYLVMFVMVNMWTISIHDGLFLSFEGVINSSAHHAEHHRLFNYNYGQYFTLWDRLFGTHRYPDHAALNPHRAALKEVQPEREAPGRMKAA